MPRVRVDRDTTEAQIVAEIRKLFAGSHFIDDQLATRNLSRSERATSFAARDSIHDEIERLTNIIRSRRAVNVV